MIPARSVLLVLAGCAFTRAEPDAIVIRNGTGQVLLNLEVAAEDEDHGVERHANYSGVPPHSDQFIKRRANPGTMPESVTISWQLRQGGPVVHRTVRIDEVEDHGGRTILIEIRPTGDVAISIEERVEQRAP